MVGPRGALRGSEDQRVSGRKSAARRSGSFTVTALDGNRATLEVNASITTKGGSGFTESAQGKTVYATDLLSPVSVELHTVIRRDISIDLADTTDARLSATMVSDTFAKR